VTINDAEVPGPEKLKILNSNANANISDEVCSQELSEMGNNDKTKTTTANQKQKKRPSMKDRLLVNQDIKRWYDNLARASPQTAFVRL
jgi:hypothetical protein